MDSKRCKRTGWDALPQEIHVRVLEMLDLASIARSRAVHKGCLHASKLIRKLRGTNDCCVFSSSKDSQLKVLPSLSTPNWRFYDTKKVITGNLCASAAGLLCFHDPKRRMLSILDTIDNSLLNIPSTVTQNTSDFVGLVVSNRKLEALVCVEFNHYEVVSDDDDAGLDSNSNWEKDYNVQGTNRFYCHVYNGSTRDTSLVKTQRNEMCVNFGEDAHSITSATLHGSFLYFTVCEKNRALEVKFALRAYDFYKKEIIKVTTWGNEFGFFHMVPGLGLELEVQPKPVVANGQLFLVGLDESSDLPEEGEISTGRYRFKLLKFDFTNKAWKMTQHAEMEFVFVYNALPPSFEVTGSGTKICINILRYVFRDEPATRLLVYDTCRDVWYNPPDSWRVGRLI